MRWLAIDPGETTGWALFDGKNLVDAGQDPLIPFIDEVWDGVSHGSVVVTAAGRFQGIRRLVIEKFALYPWVVDEGGLDFDELRTSRGIGALEFIGRHAGLDVVMQPALVKEPSMAAGARELFYRPLYENRHANDAIMHGFYYVITEMLGTRIELPSGGTAVMLNPDEPFAPASE